MIGKYHAAVDFTIQHDMNAAIPDRLEQHVLDLACLPVLAGDMNRACHRVWGSEILQLEIIIVVY